MAITALQKLAQKHTQHNVEGEWMTVRWIPDATTGECFNLGVGLRTSTGEGFIRTIDEDNLFRFKCMFGQDFLPHLKKIIKVAELCFDSDCMDISSQISFDRRGKIQGRNGTALIDHLFEIAVPLGRPSEQKTASKSRFASFSGQRLGNELIDLLRAELGVSMENLIPQMRYVTHERLSIHAPLRPIGSNIIGNWASIVYASTPRVKAEYLQAINEVRTASQMTSRKPALFLLRPDEKNLSVLKQSNLDEMHTQCDKLDQTVRAQKIDLFARTNPQELVEDILNWYEDAV